VDVASYRLATHLGLAFVILGLIAQYSLDLARGDVALIAARRAGDGRLVRWSTALLALAFVQVLLGALVAGIDAGRGFPTWPDMNGQFFPADAFYVPGGGALWHAFFENPGLVQFMHRMTGYALAALALAVWAMGRKSPYFATRRAFHAMGLAVVLQIALGIYTVLTAAAVHVAIAHQAMAVILWVLIIHARHQAGAPAAGTLRGAL
jgi:heme a synthase